MEQIKSSHCYSITRKTQRYCSKIELIWRICSHKMFTQQLEGRVLIVSNPLNDASVSVRTNTVDLTFEHKSDENVLHKLSIVFIVQNEKAVTIHKKSDQLKFQLAVIHTNKNRQLWMVSLNN